MANLCTLCGRKWPPEPVIMIMLGDDWYEFCAECVDTPDIFSNPTGEKLSPRQLFERLSNEKKENKES